MNALIRKFVFCLMLLALPLSAAAMEGLYSHQGRSSMTIISMLVSENTETLAGDKTLVVSDLPVQRLDPDGVNRNVTLPAEASSSNLEFTIYNAANGSGENLVVRDDTPAIIATLAPGMGMKFFCNGVSWVAADNEGITYDAQANTHSFDSLVNADHMTLTPDGTEPALSITMTGITGTDNQAIDITGGEILAANEEWTGIRIKPDDLDPSGADTRIRGLAVNTSGIDTTNNPDMNAVRITTPQGGRALAIDEGDFHQEITAGSDTDATYTAHEVNIDASSLDASSTFRAFNVDTTGSTSGTIVALCAKPGVAPLCQQLGAFATPDQAEYAARYPDGGAYTDGIDGNQIFVAVDDTIYIGSASAFSELEVLLTSAATKTVFPEFYYYNTGGSWVQFYPSDGTDGFVRNGLIVWRSSTFTNWKSDYDPGGADGSAGYWIKIQRTRVASPGTVTPTTIKLLAPIYYGWDKEGDVSVSTITISGSFYPGQETVTCLADACAEDVSKQVHFVVSDGGADTNADALTLDDGITAGQETTFVFKTETDVGDTIVIDTAKQVGWSDFTMAEVGDSVTFIWDGTNWTIKSAYQAGTY